MDTFSRLEIVMISRLEITQRKYWAQQSLSGGLITCAWPSISLSDADHIFTGVTGQGGSLGNQGFQWGYSVALSDFDGDGQVDVFMGGKYSHNYTIFSPCEH